MQIERKSKNGSLKRSSRPKAVLTNPAIQCKEGKQEWNPLCFIYVVGTVHRSVCEELCLIQFITMEHSSMYWISYLWFCKKFSHHVIHCYHKEYSCWYLWDFNYITQPCLIANTFMLERTDTRKERGNRRTLVWREMGMWLSPVD